MRFEEGPLRAAGRLCCPPRRPAHTPAPPCGPGRAARFCASAACSSPAAVQTGTAPQARSAPAAHFCTSAVFSSFSRPSSFLMDLSCGRWEHWTARGASRASRAPAGRRRPSPPAPAGGSGAGPRSPGASQLPPHAPPHLLQQEVAALVLADLLLHPLADVLLRAGEPVRGGGGWGGGCGGRAEPGPGRRAADARRWPAARGTGPDAAVAGQAAVPPHHGTCRRHRSTSFFSMTSAWCALRAGWRDRRAGQGRVGQGRAGRGHQRLGSSGARCAPRRLERLQAQVLHAASLPTRRPGTLGIYRTARTLPCTALGDPTSSQPARAPLGDAEGLQHGLQAGRVAGGEGGRQVGQAGQVVEVGAKLRDGRDGGGRRRRRAMRASCACWRDGSGRPAADRRGGRGARGRKVGGVLLPPAALARRPATAAPRRPRLPHCIAPIPPRCAPPIL